jgi:hypothetical protein
MVSWFEIWVGGDLDLRVVLSVELLQFHHKAVLLEEPIGASNDV